MKKPALLAALSGVVMSAVLFIQCQQKKEQDVHVDTAYKVAPKKLSEYNFFVGDIKNMEPNEGVLPYDLINPLFTDYAHKLRFVWMPKGVSAKYTKDEALDFPVGTVLVKNFYYPFDFRHPENGRRIIETRLLIHKQDKWDALAYVWNKDQTDAELKVIGASTSVDWVDTAGAKMHADYSVPNKNQCKGCHSFNGAFTPIGPKVRNLNHEYAYSDGKFNQLEKWVKQGYLTGYDAAANANNKMAKWDDPNSGTVTERARGYLDANCAHCHRAEGPANPSGLYLNFHNNNQGSLGINKTPEAAGAGGGDFLYDIIPGKPEESILPYRMRIDEPGKMMPQIGRKLVHKEALELINQWIREIPTTQKSS
jgi:uncharacterized repeat protein (TIGR03806 family)